MLHKAMFYPHTTLVLCSSAVRNDSMYSTFSLPHCKSFLLVNSMNMPFNVNNLADIRNNLKTIITYFISNHFFRSCTSVICFWFYI